MAFIWGVLNKARGAPLSTLKIVQIIHPISCTIPCSTVSVIAKGLSAPLLEDLLVATVIMTVYTRRMAIVRWGFPWRLRHSACAQTVLTGLISPPRQSAGQYAGLILPAHQRGMYSRCCQAGCWHQRLSNPPVEMDSPTLFRMDRKLQAALQRL